MIGGEFTTYNGSTTNRIVRLNTDGSIDASFNIGTGFSSNVNTIAVQNDGKIIVGGQFGLFNGNTANALARLNTNGSADAGFNIGTGFNNSVFALALQADGKIIVGGAFTIFNGNLTNARRIVRLNTDGSQDAVFNTGTGFNSDVFSLKMSADGRFVYVGGKFTNFNGLVRLRGANLLCEVTPYVVLGGTLDAFTTCAGTPSETQSYTIAGANLTSDIVITAPTGFEISKTNATSGFASSQNLTPTSGNVAETTIYIRIASTATAGNYTDSELTHTATGATTQKAFLQGAVNNSAAPTVSIAPASITTVATTFTATVSNVPSGTITYNFKKDGVSQQNTTSNTWNATGLANGNVITCEISIAGGTCILSSSATSNSVNVSIGTGSIIYVRKDGNDANDGFTNTPTGAKLTLIGGVAAVPDGGTVVLNTGTYNENVTITGKGFSLQGVGNPIVQAINVNATGKTINLIGAVGISELLRMQAGDLLTNNYLSLLSNATQQGMVANLGGSIVGNVNVQRFVPTYAERTTVQGYNYFSSPVSGKTIAEFNDDVPLVLNPNYDFVVQYAGAFPNFYRYEESRVISSPPTFNVFEKGWESPSALSEALDVGRGYILNLNSGTVIDFFGALNNGNLSLPITRGNASNAGWNLVGNPYPSPIDFDALYALNSGQIDGYNYRRIATAPYSGTWAYYVQGAGTGTNSSTNEIALGQGFFVRKTNIGISNFSFTNAVRLTTYQNPQFYRTESTESQNINGLLKIQLAGKVLKDETIVYFRKKATEQFDNAFDAPKIQFNTGGAPNVFTHTSKQNFAINGLPELSKETLVPLRFIISEKGTFTFKMTEMKHFEGKPKIYLEDRQEGILHDILQKEYTFSTNLTYDSARFFLHFLPDLTAQKNQVNVSSQALLYPNPTDSEVSISLENEVRGNISIEITDLLGRVVAAQSMEKKEEKMKVNMSIEGLPKGIYLLKINGLNYTETKKIIKQ
ncbi:T9SS type A sorting domain-containing protein [Thermoflexibacter ruber]|uniref:T9SS type A sorting domain-containing protein n=1 Tax=Thermoflexibacter ruber TaxID=1003 RepID=UPI0029371C86|nr:T9SS type A sorting domain-containing protein [Thermoflexibacter ruber]